MATKKVNTGRRFGDEKPVQRNKENMPDQKPNRSPGESNANRYMPSVKEDTDVMFSKDVERIKKSTSPTGKGAARQSQVDAGKRAGGRMLGRSGYAGYAFAAGKTAGDAIADKAIEKMSEGKVKLSDYAKKRLQEEEDFQAMQKALREVDAEKEMAKGGAVKKKMAVGGAVTTPKQQKKVAKVMGEYKAGSLHSGKGGKVVKSPKQAVAIALSEARRVKK